ncbi:MAG: DUF4340 domain-containing protein [Oscillospiraceae bacterium]|nr:DUF4340 domain-containing protein [Oscillospiraceae bacterium]
MNKQVKGLLAGCGVLAVLGGGLAALKLTEKPGEESSLPENEDPHIMLWDIPSSDDISRVEVIPQEGASYAANRRIEKQETTDYETGEKTETEVCNYYLEGLEDLPMDAASVRILATRSYQVDASSLVSEHPTDAELKSFGLDKPITVKFTSDTADPVEFSIGNRTAKGEYYLRLKGDEAVYTVTYSTVDPYLHDQNYYVGRKVTEDQSEDDKTTVNSVRLERKDLDYDIYLVYDKYYEENSSNGMAALHVMEEPVHCLLNVDRSASVTHGLYGLNSSDVVCVHPTAEQLSSYGFDDPFLKVTWETSDGKTTVFRLGNTYEKKLSDDDTQTYYYGYVDSVSCVYGFSPDDLTLDNVTAPEITAKTVVDNYVFDIASLVYKADGVTLDFKGTGSDKENYTVKLNGADTETERFRLLYTYLLKTAAEDLILEEVTPEGDPLATVELEQQDGKHGTKIAFYDAGGRKAYIAVNGRILYRCRLSYVTTLIENMKIYGDSEQEFKMSW